MPAETHQQGRTADAESVIEFLRFLLSDQRDDADEEATLSELGVDAGNIGALWHAVCEELSERASGPEMDPCDLDPSMTLVAAAKAMTSLLEAVGDDR